MRTTIRLIALVLIASATFAAPLPKRKPQRENFYPTLAGTKWDYEISETELTLKVAESATDDKAVCTLRLVTLRNDKEVAEENIRIDGEGVFRTHINKTAIEPPVCLFRHGAAAGTEWAVKSKVGSSELELAMTVGETETVQTPAGKYEVRPVVGKGTVSGAEVVIECRFAKDVGLVSQKYTIAGNTSTLALKSFTPGQ